MNPVLPAECRYSKSRRERGAPRTRKRGARRGPLLSPDECELLIIENSIALNAAEAPLPADSPEIKRIYAILTAYLRKERVICYGGIAVNYALPKKAQFYGPGDVPDYDVLSPNAIDTAKRLVDVFVANGFKDSEARAGVHYGTYKVFVNFIGILDLTDISAHVFDALYRDSIVHDGIRFAPPTWLRMSMHLELSRPLGDVSRWEKVDSRMQLLEKYHPLAKIAARSTATATATATATLEPSAIRAAVLPDVLSTLVKRGGVFCGRIAVEAFLLHDQGSADSISADSTIRVLTDDLTGAEKAIRDALSGRSFDLPPTTLSSPTESGTQLVAKKRTLGAKDILLLRCPAVGDIIPEQVQVIVCGKLIAILYQTIACHNYNEVALALPSLSGTKKQRVRIATTDTTLSVLLSLVYVRSFGAESRDLASERELSCAAVQVHLCAEKHRMDQSGIWTRFRIPCSGVQPTLASIRTEKATMFKKLTSGPRAATTTEYDKWFLKYSPSTPGTRGNKRGDGTQVNAPKKSHMKPEQRIWKMLGFPSGARATRKNKRV